MRRSIADHMVRSMATAPHVTSVFEADLSAVMAHREAHRAGFEARGAKLTYTAYFVQATVAAIQAVPEANSRWRDDGLELFDEMHIGIATSLGNGGLIVPSHAVPLASPGALGDGLRWMLDPESPFYIKPRLDVDLFNWLVRFVLASREKVMLRSLPVLRDLLYASGAMFQELADTAGFDFGYRGNGSLWVCLSKERLEKERREVHLFERFNIHVQVLDQDEVHDREPALLPQVMGGVFYPNDGHIDPDILSQSEASPSVKPRPRVHEKHQNLKQYSRRWM